MQSGARRARSIEVHADASAHDAFMRWGQSLERVQAPAFECRVVLTLMQGRDRRFAALGYGLFDAMRHCSIGGILTCACNLWCRSSAGVGRCGKVREGFGTLAVRHHLHHMIAALL